MELTQEQKERIRKNRERALAIQKRIREEKEAKERANGALANQEEVEVTRRETKKQKTSSEGNTKEEEEEQVVLEDFEIGASPFVSKKEAMKIYLLPEGTLAVCKYVEKPNPRNKSWKAMKLYHRDEIRRRSRERFGGLQGLIDERRKREYARFEKDMEESRDLFRVDKK